MTAAGHCPYSADFPPSRSLPPAGDASRTRLRRHAHKSGPRSALANFPGSASAAQTACNRSLPKSRSPTRSTGGQELSLADKQAACLAGLPTGEERGGGDKSPLRCTIPLDGRRQTEWAVAGREPPGGLKTGKRGRESSFFGREGQAKSAAPPPPALPLASAIRQPHPVLRLTTVFAGPAAPAVALNDCPVGS